MTVLEGFYDVGSTLTVPVVFVPRGDGGDGRRLQKVLDDFWSDHPLRRLQRSKRFRSYCELEESEKAKVRKAFHEGQSFMDIAATFSLFVGSVKTAAEKGRWRREADEPDIQRRIIAAIINHPTLTNAEIANIVGANPQFVRAVRKRHKNNPPTAKAASEGTIVPTRHADLPPQFNTLGEHSTYWGDLHAE